MGRWGVKHSRARSAVAMQEIEEDRSAIQEDIREEQILQKELDELEEQAERLEEEQARRRALLDKKSPPLKTNG